MEYLEYKLGELLEYEQPTKYAVKSAKYDDEYSTPVLTAGKSFILGYTNETNGIYDNLPVIIFDDFTTATQYVNFKFKVKSSAMKILKANEELALTKYLYYLMQNIHCDHDTHKRYWIQTYSKIRVSIPSLTEQKLVVSKIEELFSKLDKGVEELNKIKEQLKIYRQAVLKEAFKSDMEYKSLGDISFSRLGKMLDKNKNRGEYRPYLRNINVRWMNFDLCELLYMKIEESELEKYTATKGDLLMCEGGEPGRCAVWDMDYDICYQKAIHRIRFNKNTNPKFYMYYFHYMAQTGELSKYFTGMGIKHLTGESLKKVPVPILDIDDQQSILKCIEQRLSVCEKIEQTVNESLQKAESLRQSILKQAFEGKLV